MELYVSEFSKYVIAFLLIFYTYECFAVFRFEEEQGKEKEFISGRIFLCFCFILAVFLLFALRQAILPTCSFMRSNRSFFMRQLCYTICFILKQTV